MLARWCPTSGSHWLGKILQCRWSQFLGSNPVAEGCNWRWALGTCS